MRTLAFARDAELTANESCAPFGALVRSATRTRMLGPKEYTALWWLCGAQRRRGSFAPSEDELARVMQQVVGDGLLVEIEAPDVAIGAEHRVALAGGVDLRPAVYEVRDARRLLRFVGVVDAVLLDACDGRHTMPEVQSAARNGGFPLAPAELQNQLARLQAAGMLEVAGTHPRRRADLMLRPDAVIVRAPGREVAFLVSGEEADVLVRCETARNVGELVAELQPTTDEEARWITATLAKACAVQLLSRAGGVVPRAPIVAQRMPQPFVDMDSMSENTAVEDLEGDTVLQRPDDPTPSGAGEIMARPPEPKVFRISAPKIAEPPSRASAPRIAEAVPARIDDAGVWSDEPAPPPQAPQPAFRISAPQMTEPPVRRSAPQMTEPPVRRSAPQLAEAPTEPARRPSEQPPFRISAPQMAEPAPRTSPHAAATAVSAPLPPADPVMQARLAKLAGLSLQKDAAPQPRQRATGGGGSQKLPWILLAIVVIGGGTYHFMTVRGQNDSPQVAAHGDAGTQAAVATVAPHSLLASGFVAAKTPIVLSATISGRVDSVAVEEGDKITKGQVLAVIADAQIRAELGLARAKVHDASRAHARMAALVKAQAATPVDLEKAIGAEEIALAEMRVTQQKLDETKIKSPIDGTVLEVLAHPGELLAVGPNGGAGVLKIADLSILIAEVNVNEVDLKNVFIGQEADVITDAQRDQAHKGIVREISEQADRAKGTVLVKVDIQPSTDTVLKPGMAIQVSFLPKGTTTASGSGSAAP